MAIAAHTPTLVQSVRRAPSRLALREAAWGLLFLSPWIIGFLAFTALPMIASLVLSFTDFDLVRPEETRFIGLENYFHLLNDSLVIESLLVTIRFALIAIPLGLAVPLGLAALLNSRHLLGRDVFRTLFYLPSIVPLVAGTLIFAGVFNTQTGWINLALESVGLPGPDWLNSKTWIYPALAIIGLWGIGNAMVTMLAGMQGVPSELYDAARVDGAGPVRMFFNITVPMISPVIFYNLTLSLIGTFQYFTVAYVLKNGTGDPGNATLFYNLYLYKVMFTYNNMGYAAALAWLLFVIVLMLTVILFGTARRWVYYEAER
ncbi:MAG: sugar ABC transporter permease [Anaerolineales bacterium]|nr:sugar ABC transporter permease [Anaerolineales bacterium]